MDDLKLIFKKLLLKININDGDAEKASEMFIDQVYASFVEKELELNLQGEQYDKKIEEYQGYIKEGKHGKVHMDVKQYIGEDADKILADVYMTHLKKFFKELLEEGEITEDGIKEVSEYFSEIVSNTQLKSKMQGQGPEDNLQMLAE